MNFLLLLLLLLKMYSIQEVPIKTVFSMKDAFCKCLTVFFFSSCLVPLIISQRNEFQDLQLLNNHNNNHNESVIQHSAVIRNDEADLANAARQDHHG